VKKPTIRWLDRSVLTLPFHLVLCTSQKRFDEVMDFMHVPASDRRNFPAKAVKGGFGGWASMFEKEGDLDICVVCVVPTPEDPATALATLVHEAVHVWQNAKQKISRDFDVGREPEAYAVEAIYSTLMDEYARQVPTAAKPPRSRRAAKRTRRTA